MNIKIDVTTAFAAMLTIAAAYATTCSGRLVSKGKVSRRNVVVMDAETGKRVRDAVITTSCGSDTTKWDGTACMPLGCGKGTVFHHRYLTCHLPDSLCSDTIRLIPKAHALAEVEVWGHYGTPGGKLYPEDEDNVETQLVANQEAAKGFNPLGLIAWGVRKLLPRRPKLTRKEKQKIIMDNY